MIGRDVLSNTSFMDAAGDMVTIRLPRKMCLSISTARVIQMRNR
jgi:hypothetical protein